MHTSLAAAAREAWPAAIALIALGGYALVALAPARRLSRSRRMALAR